MTRYNAVKAKDGVNGLTRANDVRGAQQHPPFNADGMFGTIDLAGRETSPCHVLMQVKSGTFVRVFPTKPGTFDCTKKNVVAGQARRVLIRGPGVPAAGARRHLFWRTGLRPGPWGMRTASPCAKVRGDDGIDGPAA